MKEFRFISLPFIMSVLFCYWLMSWSPFFAQAQPLQWSGSVKSIDIYSDGSSAGLTQKNWSSSNQARLNSNWTPFQNFQLETAIDYQYFWSDQAGIFKFPPVQYNRRLNLDKAWQHGENGISRLDVDRLNLQWSCGPIDTNLGRQALGFGRILIYSPLDVIAPFAPYAIDTEIRRGVDAVHLTFNYAIDGQISAIAVWGEENKYNSLLTTWSDNSDGLDLLMIGGQLRGRTMFGFGVAGSLGSLGLKGEVSIHNGQDKDEIGGDIYDSYAIGAIETWYRFDNGISLITQYLYNGPGSEDPEDYPEVLASAPVQEGLTYLLGRHYLIIAPSYDVHPLATLQGLVIYNIADKSALLRPLLDLNLADNLSLQLFYTGHFGKQPHVAATYLPAELRSEFGAIGDNFGLFLNWYF
jgi:hypothetical protein